VVVSNTSPTKTHSRPIRVYLWYPAKGSGGDQAMQFRRYAELADQDIWPAEIAAGLHSQLRYSTKVLARSLGPDRFEQLLKQPVLAIDSAQALDGSFPLIVMGQGLYYESPIVFAALAEYLAARGFVVASCPLVGTNSPIVKMTIQDLETQIRDLEFVVSRARKQPFVSPDMLGVFGFDMGGMAGLILTMRNADVDAFVSVSSGILYQRPDGLPTNSPHYDPLKLRTPWLHSVPGYWIKPDDANAESLFDTASQADRYLLLTKGLGHVDYTSYALIPGRRAMSGYWGPSNPDNATEHNAVNTYIYNFFAAFLKQDANSRAFLAKDPKQVFPDLVMTMDHRTAEPALINYGEFVLAVITGKSDKAIEKVRALRETSPGHVLLQEASLERLVWSLRDTWGLHEKVMPVIQLRVELFPQSDSAHRMLAEGYAGISNFPAAIEVYEQVLEKNPDDKYIQGRLDWLQKQ